MPSSPMPPTLEPIGAPFDIVIFDCDGVLIDSEALSHGIEAALFRELGADIDDATYIHRFAGLLVRDIAPTLAAEQGLVLPPGPELAGQMRTRVQPVFEAELTALPGMADLLGDLTTRAVPIAVASGSGPERLDWTLKLTGLHSLVAGRIYSAAMVARPKPAPDVYLHASSEMGMAPERAIAIEDSVPGLRAAVAAGMTAVGFTAGGHIADKAAHGERLTAAGAHYVAHKASDLRSLLGLAPA